MTETHKTALQIGLDADLKKLPEDTRIVLEVIIAQQNANHSDAMSKLVELESRLDPISDVYKSSIFAGKIVAAVLGTVIAFGGAYAVIKGLFTK